MIPNVEVISKKSSEVILYETEIRVENKIFIFSLIENSRGRVLRIQEEVKHHRNVVMIPSEVLRDVAVIINEVRTVA